MSRNLSLEIDSLELLLMGLKDKFKCGIQNGADFAQTKDIYLKIKELNKRRKDLIQRINNHSTKLNLGFSQFGKHFNEGQ